MNSSLIDDVQQFLGKLAEHLPAEAKQKLASGLLGVSEDLLDGGHKHDLPPAATPAHTHDCPTCKLTAIERIISGRPDCLQAKDRPHGMTPEEVAEAAKWLRSVTSEAEEHGFSIHLVVKAKGERLFAMVIASPRETAPVKE